MKIAELQRAFRDVAGAAAEAKGRAAAAVARERQLSATCSELSSLAKDQRGQLLALRDSLA